MLLLGAIEAMKRHYKKKVITHILECEENLNEALKNKCERRNPQIAHAWQLVKAATIRKSFHKIIVQKRREDESQQTENPPTDGELFEIINGIEECEEVLKRTFSSRWTLKTNIQVFKSLMMKKLYKALIPSSDINDADNEDQDFENLRTISHTEGVQALTTALFGAHKRCYADRSSVAQKLE
ncbi:hypothetical protein AVEN_83086-1 [Araneus ventricosus]|uniref:DDE-1 domain-containing protein n=1 Tax=Araneus ventricosus TaxID=182803 RepID=A0A4Y2AP43_ARAVE|nr:hypothetical protein AVEN_83086-1 [Araneus ventricosus]